GTEPKIRIMVEGIDNKLVREIANTVAEAVCKTMT
ncbi:MAG: hypothetical protein HQL02_12915, partial [Nitrospirae bacterium]|nr:hypothetical protein [Nitrospirota bacterium]